MRKIWLALVLCLISSLSAQVFCQHVLHLKTGTFSLLPVDPVGRMHMQDHYLFYRSDHVLTSEERTSLREDGVNILYALRDNTYWVKVSSFSIESIREKLFEINPSYKEGFDPDARASINRFRLSVAFGLAEEAVRKWSMENNIRIVDLRALRYGLLDVEIYSSKYESVLNTPWVSYIGPIPEDVEVNYRGIHGERGWALTSPLGRNLHGDGMTIGIGDGGRVQVHEDLSRSYLDLTSFGTANHPTQVSGIVTGAGLIDPFYGAGYAPEANVILRNFSDILWDAPQYKEDFGLTITNNSYGSSLVNCTYFGDYDGTSAGLDAMMHDIPSLLHVFSSGNSGGGTCSPFPVRYGTISGGYQVSKNLLTVGSVNNEDASSSFSSCGPVDDGRLKPEVVAYGGGRYSTVGTNQYDSASGTSFSSPATMGTATLLYQRYKQLHNDSLPDAALIKNVICNSADDLGNTGPDFIYGFGRINGDRAAAILENQHHLTVNVDHGNVITRTFTIPANTAETDVMIMWTDETSAPFETVTLVNDLDITVVRPQGDTIKPWILNVTPSGVSSPASSGNDHYNNYEQITLPNPIAGTYTIVIKGHRVPLGPQRAWISWDNKAAGIKVQFPNGGEVIKPDFPASGIHLQYIRWDAYGTGNSTFQVEYSTNNGSSWTTLSNSVTASARHLNWLPPNVISNEVKVRVTASNGMQDVSDATAIIMLPPTNLVATSPCNGNIQLSWTAIAGVSKYRVFVIKNEKLYPIDTTSATSFIIRDQPVDSAVWVTVAGVFPSGAAGLRARAVSVTANGGNACTWANDLRLDSLVSLEDGRKFTSTELTNTEAVTIHLTNTGTTIAHGFSLYYQLNGTLPAVQSFPDTLDPGEGVNFTFIKPAALATVGNYQLKAWLSYASDPFKKNDTINVILQQLDNTALSLPWSEDFENAEEILLLKNSFGIPGVSSVDVQLSPGARHRTHAGSPFCFNGDRAITVDAVRTTMINTPKHGEFVMTLNLAAYDVTNDDIRLSFHAMHHEIILDNPNTEAVYIRGADTLPYVLLTMLSNNAQDRAAWKNYAGLEVSEILDEAGQDFSSSFQVKFVFDVYATAGQANSQDGQSIDHLQLTRINKDLAITGISNPVATACDLGNETIVALVSNTSNLIVGNADLHYRVNGGSINTTPIGPIATDTTIEFSLSPAYNFSAGGIYHLEIWSTSAEDDFAGNDTFRTDILQSELITTLPYLEGFENEPGNWLANGTNSSWAHGVPGKQNFSRAAEGKNVWTTSLSGLHNADEISYLYSPCIDLQGLAQPYLSFAIQYQLEVNYDYAWVEYKLSGSNTWVKLGSLGSGVNWYTHATHAWNGSQLKWITCGHAIPFTDTIIQFRWVMQSDVGVEMEGIAIDQVHVYDRVAMYNGGNVQVTQAVSGNDWVHVNSGGQRLLSIHPMGQNLGNVTVNLYKAGGNFQLTDSLYLLSRNWVVSSTLPPVTPIKMRSYFTSTEANNLVSATGCNQCISARDAFDVATLRYTGANQDGSYANNTSAQVTTYPLDSTLIIPYDIGYVAEWTTPGMSEWWITSKVTKWSGNLETRIAAANDDAEEHEVSGSVNPYRSSLALTEYEGKQKLGWRFKHITIPKGSYIQSAHLEWTNASNQAGPANWTLQSQLDVNPATFITTKYNISSRSRSQQIIQWSPIAWTTLNNTYSSPEVKHLIQQVVDQAGWVTGKDLALILRGDGFRDAWSYEGDSLKGARLVISYTSLCNETGICYVNKNATGSQDGNSWANAYRTLQQALDRAAHCAGIDEIWVAGGTYTPFVEVTRSNGFILRPGVRIYGGFQGNETSIAQRVYGMFPTILSGDIGVQGNSSDNLFHVITTQSGAEESILDGLTIKDGLANGGTLPDQRGSAINNFGNLRVQKVTIQSSSAPSVYNAPGAGLSAFELLEIKL